MSTFKYLKFLSFGSLRFHNYKDSKQNITCIKIPASRCSIVAWTENEVACANYPINQRIVSSEDEHTVTRINVPFSDGFIRTSRQNESVFNESSVNVVVVAFKDPDALAVRGLGAPQPRGLILRARHQNRTILTQCHAVDTSSMLRIFFQEVCVLFVSTFRWAAVTHLSNFYTIQWNVEPDIPLSWLN